MLSSLSSVPPVWPRPRPEIIGTAAPQAARIGARISETLSPTPPVECLSSTGRSRSHSSTVPESRMPVVSAIRSPASRPLKKNAIASAPTWASDSPPSVMPLTRKWISSGLSAAPSRFFRITSGASTSIVLRESLYKPHEVARGDLGIAQRLLVRELLAAHALGEVRDRRDRSDAQAGVAGQDHLGHGGHPDRVGAEGPEHPDLRGGLERRAGGGEVDAFGQVDVKRARRRAQPVQQRRVVGAAQAREAR